MNLLPDEYVDNVVNELSITHYGIKGMKWKDHKPSLFSTSETKTTDYQWVKGEKPPPEAQKLLDKANNKKPKSNSSKRSLFSTSDTKTTDYQWVKGEKPPREAQKLLDKANKKPKSNSSKRSTKDRILDALESRMKPGKSPTKDGTLSITNNPDGSTTVDKKVGRFSSVATRSGDSDQGKIASNSSKYYQRAGKPTQTALRDNARGQNEMAPKKSSSSRKKTRTNDRAIVHAGVKGMKWRNKKGPQNVPGNGAPKKNPAIQGKFKFTSKGVAPATAQDAKNYDKLSKTLFKDNKAKGVKFTKTDDRRHLQALYKKSDAKERSRIKKDQSSYAKLNDTVSRQEKALRKRGDYGGAYRARSGLDG